MSKLSFNQINSLKGTELTPTQKQMQTKIRLSKPRPRRVNAFPNNNDPCPCGSKKKYKNCCKYA